MPNRSPQWLIDYEAKRNPRPPITSGVESESALHDSILEECKRRGWIAFHSRMDKPQTGNVGTPDFIIAASDGRTFYVECKRKGGKCSAAQNATLAWLALNKQISGVVSSLEEFILLTK